MEFWFRIDRVDVRQTWLELLGEGERERLMSPTIWDNRWSRQLSKKIAKKRIYDSNFNKISWNWFRFDRIDVKQIWFELLVARTKERLTFWDNHSIRQLLQNIAKWCILIQILITVLDIYSGLTETEGSKLNTHDYILRKISQSKLYIWISIRISLQFLKIYPRLTSIERWLFNRHDLNYSKEVQHKP